MTNNTILLNINGVNNTASAFQQVQQQARQAASSVTNAFQTVGNSMKSVGKAMTAAITVPVVGIVGSSIKTAMTFEQQMSKVQAVCFATAEEMQDLTEKAKEIGSTTTFTATEAAQGLEYMAQAGWKTRDMLNGLNGVVKLANAGGLDMARTSEIMAAGIAAFKMEAAETGKLADILAAGANAAMTDVDGMGESFKYAAPVAGTLGMSVEDTTIALGLMANMGIQASTAGTSLRSALTNLANPTKKMQKMLNSLGMSLTDSNGETKSLKEIMDEMRRTFSRLTEAEKAQAAATIFGKNAMSGMLAIVDASEDDYNKLTSAVYSATDGIGVGAKMQEIMTNNLSGQITLLKSAWEGIQLKIAESVLPTIKKFVEFVQKLADKINSMNPKLLDFIVKMSLVAAAIGPVIWIAGQMITSLIAIKKGITAVSVAFGVLKTALTTGTLASAFNPTLWIIAAISVAVVGLAALIAYKWDWLTHGWSEMCENVKIGWNYVVDGIKKGVGQIGDFLTELFDNVKTGAEFIAKPFIEAGKWIVDTYMKIAEIMNKLSLSIIAISWHIGEAIIEGITTNVSKGIAKIKSIFGSITKAIQNALRPAVTFVRNLINNIKDAFVTGFNFIKTKISGIFDVISNVFKKLKSFYGKVVEVLRPVMSIVENFKKGFETIMEKIIEVFMGIYNQYNAFVEKFRSFISDVKKDLTDFINAIINGINHLTSGLNKLKITIKGVEELGIPDINWGFNIAQIPNLPSLSVGTSEVLKDGLAVIHKGEAVVPAQVNPWRNDVKVLNRDTQRQVVEVVLRDERSDQNININLDGRVLANALNKRTRVDYLVRG
jgi:TP901 family phage tail tape measure protein